MKIFISVKYQKDHFLERSLSAYLMGKGHETYRHNGTIELLKRAALPPEVDNAPAQLFTSALSRTDRQMKPYETPPDLIERLINNISSHEVFIAIWTADYAASYWCILELQAAILLKKPMLVLHADRHELTSELAQMIASKDTALVTLDLKYQTSNVKKAIEQLDTGSHGMRPSESVIQEVQAFAAEYKPDQREAMTKEVERVLHANLVWRLWQSHEANKLHEAIPWLAERNAFDAGVRHYLECAAAGVVEARLEPSFYTYLLGEILDTVFIPPTLPARLQELYEDRIKRALNFNQSKKVEALFDEMIGQCLYGREFVEHFGRVLQQSVSSRTPATDNLWELCTRRIPEAV